jgi:DNA-binding MarR family transcriptional regulator
MGGQLARSGTPPLLAELARVPGHVIWRAAAKVGARLDAELPVRMGLRAYAALLALEDGEARSQAWLAECIAVSKTTMTKIATALVEAGLVERVRNPDDRRSYALTRTERAASVDAEWRAHTARLEDAMGEGLSAAEHADLRALLRRVAEPRLAEGTPEALRASTGFLITWLHARLQAEGTAALREMDLEPRFMGSFIVLRKLGPVSQAELARQLGITTPSVVEIVDDLEARGLVERRRDPDDRRTQRLHLTPASGPVGDHVRARLMATTDAYLGVLDADERARLLALLVRFVNAGTATDA